MKERFEGDGGRSALIETLKTQGLLGQNENVASLVAEKSILKEYKKGDYIITQNNQDRDVVFIIMGSVDVLVGGKKVADRNKGEAVGEMSSIDPTVVRSASIVAREVTVVARLEHNEYTAILDRYPVLWKNVALSIAERLRQRGNLVRQVNNIPRIFIASASEDISTVRDIRGQFAHDSVIVRPWMDIFGAGDYTLDALNREIELSDFSISIFSANDTTSSRGKRNSAPRDNVILEFGMFTGILGLKRSFIILKNFKDGQKNIIKELKLPSDIDGITMFSVKGPDFESSIANICDKIRKKIVDLGPRT